MGGLHLFCEDYACHGQRPVPHVILSDGCSSSPDTDVGARLLVLTARRRLAVLQQPTTTEDEKIEQHWRFGHQVAALSTMRVERLGLPVSVLDATLLVAYHDEAGVSVHLYGDGCIGARREDGRWEFIQVEYAHNAPFYLSYLTDAERQHSYIAMIGTDCTETAQTVHRTTVYQESDAPETVETVHQSYDTPLFFSFDWHQYNLIALASDGLHSFFLETTGERLNGSAIARSLLTFRHTGKDFLKQRVRQLLLQYAGQGIHPFDDVSLGVFVKTAIDQDADTAVTFQVAAPALDKG